MLTSARADFFATDPAHRRLAARRVNRIRALSPVAPQFAGVGDGIGGIDVYQGLVRIRDELCACGNLAFLKPRKLCGLRHSDDQLASFDGCTQCNGAFW